MQLNKFKDSRKTKIIVYIIVIGIVIGFIIGYSYYTYAFYNDSKKYNVINGTIPEFNVGDVRIAYTINGKNVSGLGFPNKDFGFMVKEVLCENGVTANWLTNNWALEIQDSNKQDKIKCSIDFTAPTMSEYLINLSKRDNSILSQEHEETEQTGSNATIDYRFVGLNPNNYICLENDGKCKEDELYRIIGVIPTQSSESGDYENRVKLVKSTNYVGATALNITDIPGLYNYTKEGVGYHWGESKDWTTSTTNKAVLNKEYWDKISDYQKYISESKWYLGRRITNTLYAGERSLDKYQNYPIFEVSNIALMYPSDIVYATGSSDSLDRKTCLEMRWYGINDAINCLKNNNWLYQGPYDEWVLFNTNSDDCCSFMVLTSKDETIDNGTYNRIMGIRPSFYLNASVKYANGNGTKDNPYQVTID